MLGKTAQKNHVGFRLIRKNLSGLGHDFAHQGGCSFCFRHGGFGGQGRNPFPLGVRVFDFPAQPFAAKNEDCPMLLDRLHHDFYPFSNPQFLG